MSEKRKTDAPGFPCGRVLLMLIAMLVICAVVGLAGLYQSFKEISSELEQVSTGEDARPLINGLLGTSLPTAATHLEYRVTGFLDSFAATLRFSLPPVDVGSVLADAKPSSFRCLILPLKEGVQAHYPDCPTGAMTITIDKRNPDLWQVEISATGAA
jgi:hypothetical protein